MQISPRSNEAEFYNYPQFNTAKIRNSCQKILFRRQKLVARPQDSAQTRVSGQMAEEWGSRQWLTQLLSDWRVAYRGKLAATAALAMLPDRNESLRLLWRLAIVSAFFIYKYLVVLEVIVGCLVLAEVAIRLIPLFTSRTQSDERGSAISNAAASTSSCYGGNRATPNGRGRRQTDAIQQHLQRLAMAAAAADGTSVSSATNVAPMLLQDYQDQRLAVGFPGTNGITSTLMVTASNTSGSSPPPAARSGHQEERSPRLSSEHRRKRENPTEAIDGRSVVIHFQFPVYVCDLTFWNDVRITVPSSSRPPSLSTPSAATAGKSHETTRDRVVQASSGSTSSRPASDAACYHIKMRMWVEMNRDLVGVETRSARKPCEDCLMGSHSVGKRRFDCTYLNGYLEGPLDVHKNTFHAGRKLTILGSNSGLNFKFETALEQTPARPGGSNGPASFQQRVTFALLPKTSKPNNQQQKSSSRVDGGSGSSAAKKEGGSGSGLLGALFRRSRGDSKLTTTSKCSVEALYSLEDRRRPTRGSS